MRGRYSDRPRDASLSLRWESRDHWQSIDSALGCEDGSETFAAVAIALYTEATGDNRWISYSRNRNHYTMPRRYRSPLYTRIAASRHRRHKSARPETAFR